MSRSVFEDATLATVADLRKQLQAAEAGRHEQADKHHKESVKRRQRWAASHSLLHTYTSNLDQAAHLLHQAGLTGTAGSGAAYDGPANWHQRPADYFSIGETMAREAELRAHMRWQLNRVSEEAREQAARQQEAAARRMAIAREAQVLNRVDRLIAILETAKKSQLDKMLGKHRAAQALADLEEEEARERDPGMAEAMGACRRSGIAEAQSTRSYIAGITRRLLRMAMYAERDPAPGEETYTHEHSAEYEGLVWTFMCLDSPDQEVVNQISYFDADALAWIDTVIDELPARLVNWLARARADADAARARQLREAHGTFACTAHSRARHRTKPNTGQQ